MVAVPPQILIREGVAARPWPAMPRWLARVLWLTAAPTAMLATRWLMAATRWLMAATRWLMLGTRWLMAATR